jgi:hypothetical protein
VADINSDLTAKALIRITVRGRYLPVHPRGYHQRIAVVAELLPLQAFAGLREDGDVAASRADLLLRFIEKFPFLVEKINPSVASLFPTTYPSLLMIKG